MGATLKPEHILLWGHPIAWGGTALFTHFVFGLSWPEVLGGLAIVAVMVVPPVLLIRLKLREGPAERTIDAPYWRVIDDERRLLP